MATYDIEALKADLPTAKDLAQFVYDRTQIALDLIGKPKEDQYLVAKNALEGKKVPSEFITDENPYVEKKDLIPADELPPMPGKHKDVPEDSAQVHYFGATNMPHPHDPQSDRKVAIDFRKYENNVITLRLLVLLSRSLLDRVSINMVKTSLKNIRGLTLVLKRWCCVVLTEH